MQGAQRARAIESDLGGLALPIEAGEEEGADEVADGLWASLLSALSVSPSAAAASACEAAAAELTGAATLSRPALAAA